MRAGAARFRRGLRLFQSFVLKTRLLGWIGTRFIIEQRILTARDVVATRALVLVGFYDRRGAPTCRPAKVFERMGLAIESPPLNPAAETMRRVEDLLKEERADLSQLMHA
jgi:hypothetical protein